MSLILQDELVPGVLLVTLNDPEKLNAMSEAMAEAFRAMCHARAETASTLRAIILTGKGRAFSAGGDLEMLKQKQKLSGEQNRLLMRLFYDSFLGIRKLGVPLIAAVNGHAVGAGLCLAAACDIRLASEESKLGFTFTKLGLHPGLGATYFLPRLVGPARAAELLLGAKMISAGEALSFDLVNQVVKNDQVVSAAHEQASAILSCGPQATRQLLETLRGGDAGLSQALEREAICQAINYASPEFAEGLSSVAEKRTAKW